MCLGWLTRWICRSWGPKTDLQQGLLLPNVVAPAALLTDEDCDEPKPTRLRLLGGAEAQMTVLDPPALAEAQGLKLTVQNVIYEYQDDVRVLTVVFPCGQRRACLKLRRGGAEHERAVHAQMRGTPIEALFVRVHFFCTVLMPDGTLWGGYCMDLADFTISHFISVDVRAVSKHAYFARCGWESAGAEVGGEPVDVDTWPSIPDAVTVACLRLLARMHRAGWVHGDSHGGNFMCLRGRVVAIDFERSFRCDAPVQHLLDMQEFFGHVTGVCLSRQHPERWDFRHCLGVYVKRRPACGFLPLCHCFTAQTPTDRLSGCELCHSPCNRAAAVDLARDPESHIRAVGDAGLYQLRVSLGATRLACIQQVRAAAQSFYPCLAARNRYTSLQDCTDMLWLELYAPAVCKKATDEMNALLDKMRACGYAEQAAMLLQNVCF